MKMALPIIFSDNNKDTQWQQKYLPDAEKYPMKQTEWMNDNTGRIRRQGGVGPQYQLGSGHETFYYDGVPAMGMIECLETTQVMLSIIKKP